jgi:hypothetical protein
MKNNVIRFCLIISIFLFTATAFAFGQADILVKRYSEAHNAGNFEALQELVYWEGATDMTRENVVKRLKMGLEHPIKQIKFSPATNSDQFSTKAFEPNLEPVGRLVITIESPDGETEKSFIVGEHDGEYMISVAKRLNFHGLTPPQTDEKKDKKDE